MESIIFGSCGGTDCSVFYTVFTNNIVQSMLHTIQLTTAVTYR